MQIALNSGSTSMDFATEFCQTITTLCPGVMLREFVKAWTLEHIYLFSTTAQGGPNLLLLYSKWSHWWPMVIMDIMVMLMTTFQISH